MTRETMPEYMSSLAGLTENANALRLAVIEEADWAMVANQLRTIEKDLAIKRREIEGLATEAMQEARRAEPTRSPMTYESDQGELREQITKTRSFNTSGILVALMGHADDMSLGEAISIFQSANALELKWKVSFLENVADRYGFDLPTTHHEIADGDPDYLVGVVSTSKAARG